ncbi:MAG: PstS family phosphate ABC transporter substrate-binding protein [Methanomassiliicoccales archaeon]
MNAKSLIAIAVVVVVVIAAIGAVFLMGGGNDDGEETIAQKGSDTLLELMQNGAEQFHQDQTGISVQVTGGGSGTGIAALINGQVDVAQASREMKDSEMADAQSAGVDPVRFRVAIDGIAIVVNSDNTVDQLTIEQLRGIYDGSIDNWEEVGGADEDIVAYGRQSTSGTYGFFQEVVLEGEDYAQDMQSMQGNSEIVSSVKDDERGIGYVGVGYADGASGISIANLSQDGDDYYSPLDSDAVYSEDYPLWRYLNLYVDSDTVDSDRMLRVWISWILEPSGGQEVVENVGFYPLSLRIIDEEMVKLAKSQTIVQKGSDTLLELMQNGAEAFDEEYDTISVQVTGGGSGTGIAALINGQVDVAQASREMKDSEMADAQSAGVDPVRFRVAIDGIAIVVNSDNTVDQLTIEQLRGIYDGSIDNWEEVGGADEDIVAYGRQSTSGTYGFFQEVVLEGEDYAQDMQSMQGNSEIVSSVKDDERGIGYVGVGYADGASGISIANLSQDGDDYYSPLDSDAVYSEDYPLWRYLNLYVDSDTVDSDRMLRVWISWILEPSGGQEVVENVGFYPLDSATISEELAKLGYE